MTSVSQSLWEADANSHEERPHTVYWPLLLRRALPSWSISDTPWRTVTHSENSQCSMSQTRELHAYSPVPGFVREGLLGKYTLIEP